MGVRPLAEKDKEMFKKGFESAKSASQKYNLLILDEFIIGLNFGIIKKEEVVNFLKKYGKKLDIVLTGRYCPKN